MAQPWVMEVEGLRNSVNRSGLEGPAQPRVMNPSGPFVWLVIGDKVGDNRQVELIASALGWPTVRKELRFRPPYDRREGKPPIRPTLDHLDRDRSAPLEPPWPDLILTIGRRPLAASLWLKRQRPKSRLVVVGRPVPARYLPLVDLMVVPPSYLSPRNPNVLPLPLPLHQPPLQAVAEAAARWRERLEGIARPLVAVMVGGETRPFRFGAREAGDLLLKVQRAFPEGTLYFTTSRRTPPEVVETLSRNRPSRARIYRYGIDPENPYLALLALADRVVVTGDSVSMAVEALQCQKPLWIYELPTDLHLKERWRSRFFHPPWRPLWEVGYRFGIFSAFRDLRQFHQLLYRRRWAVAVGSRREPHPPERFPDSLRLVVEACQRLF